MSPDEPEAATVEPVGETPEEGAGFEAERQLAAVAYILTIITGIVVLLLAKTEQKYARWHALQAIGIGFAAILLQIAVAVLQAILSVVGLPTGPDLFPFGLPFFFGSWLLGNLVTVGMIVLVIVLAVKAYSGETVRLPLLADLADQHA